MSDAVWLAILGIVAMAVKELLDQRKARAADAKTAKVKADLQADTAKQNETLTTITEKVETVRADVKTVESNVNGKMQMLLEDHGVIKKAEGVAEGKAEAKQAIAEMREAAKDAVAAILPAILPTLPPPPLPPAGGTP